MRQSAVVQAGPHLLPYPQYTVHCIEYVVKGEHGYDIALCEHIAGDQIVTPNLLVLSCYDVSHKEGP